VAKSGHDSNSSSVSVLPPSRWHTIRPLLAFTGLYVLVYAGESVKYGFLPLTWTCSYTLNQRCVVRLIGIQPLVELAIMPFCVTLGRRVDFCGLCASARRSASQRTFALPQLLMRSACSPVRSYGRCLGYFRVAWHHRCTAVASDCRGYGFCNLHELDGSQQRSWRSYGALGVATVGLPEIFFIPAAFAFLAVLGLGAMARSGALKSRPAGDSM